MVLTGCEHLAVLTREFGVRVINGSESGCLIECPISLEVGRAGTLCLRFGMQDYGDDIEVVRCTAVGTNGTVYHVGMRYLWTTPRLGRSIRHAIWRYAGELSAMPTTMRLM